MTLIRKPIRGIICGFLFNLVICSSIMAEIAQKSPEEKIESPVASVSEIEWEVNLKEDWKRKNITGKAMYLPEETVTFLINLKNKDSQPKRLVLSRKISNFRGILIEEKEQAFKIKPMNSISIPWTYKPMQNGVFYVRFASKINKRLSSTKTITFSVIPPEIKSNIKPENSPFGVCWGILDTMPVGGLRWERHDFYWDWIEVDKGKFKWDEADAFVEKLEKYNLRAMTIISFIGKEKKGDMVGQILDMEKWSRPVTLKDWGDYVTALVSRYKGRINCWEILSEPNRWPYYIVEGKPVKYIEFLKTAYLAAKEVDPGCLIVGGVSSPIDLPFYEDLFKSGGHKYLDVVSIHPYRPGYGSPEDTDFMEEVMKIKNLLLKYEPKGKPIWMTEFGWPSDDTDPISPKLVADGTILPDWQYAAYIVRQYTMAMSEPLFNRFFIFLHTHPAKSLSEAIDDGQSLLYNDNKAKPVMAAHRTLCDELEGAKFIKKKMFEDLHVYTYKQDEKKINIIWNSQESQAAFVRTKKKTVLVDIMNNRKEIPERTEPFIRIFDEVPVFWEGEIEVIDSVWAPVAKSGEHVSLDKPQSLEVEVKNPTKKVLVGEIYVSSSLAVKPGQFSFCLNGSESRTYTFKVAVTDPTHYGRKKVIFKLNLPKEKVELTHEEDFMMVLPKAIVIDNFESDRMKDWWTNINEKHVEYNKYEISSEQAYDGKKSLYWRCKSGLWNHLNLNPSHIDTKDVKQIEFWIYLPRLPVGSNTLSLEFDDTEGHRFGYWAKIPLNKVGKWTNYVIDMKDLIAHPHLNPDAKLNLSSGLRTIYFNYTSGELDIYIDNILLRE